MGKEYLIIYDVRGIQNYIFRSNKIKEITGASIIVRDKLKDLLCDILKDKEEDKEKDKGLTKESFEEWKSPKKGFEFINVEQKNNAEQKKCEVVYEGGGNLVLAYRTEAEDKEGQEEEIKKFNRILQMRFFEETYSLSLAYAYVEMTKNYDKDLIEVKKKLSEVKERMPQLVISPANSLTCINQYTSQVLSKKNNSEDITRESYLKLKAYEKVFEKSKETDKTKEINRSKVLIDEIAQEQNANSNKTMIAVVHIDGNGIGNMITRFKNTNASSSYEESVNVSRKISKKINDAFTVNFEDIINEKKNTDSENKPEILYRDIINSGDDITFICKAEYAIELTRRIMTNIESEVFSEDDHFSSCAGIAFVHSHFPFSKAYEIAEECCSRAKKKANEYKENRKDIDENKNNILSFLDYEIISSGIIDSLDSIYEQKSKLYMKPYCVAELEKYIEKFKGENDVYKPDGKFYHIKQLYNNINVIEGLARSNIKELRDNYQVSKNDVNFSFARIKCKNKILNDKKVYDNNDIAEFYEACSLYDLIDRDLIEK